MSAQDPETLAEVAADVDMAEEELQAIFADVEQALEDLAGFDVDVNSAADLEAVRKRLPTKAVQARLLNAALPPSLRNALEYVPETDRQSAYWRRSKEKRDVSEISDAELVRRYEFSRAAERVRGQRGTSRTGDGREISRAAEEIGEQMEGREFDPTDGPTDTDREKGKALLQRISDWL